MWLLHGHKKLQEGILLKYYDIANDTLILLVSRLNRGAKGWDAPSSSQTWSFKDALNPGLSQPTPKDISSLAFTLEQAKDIQELEVEVSRSNLFSLSYDQNVII